MLQVAARTTARKASLKTVLGSLYRGARNTGRRFALERQLRARSALAAGTRAAAAAVRPRGTILFIPDAPGASFLLGRLCKLAGYRVVRHPESHHDVVFKWRTATFFDPDELAGVAPLDRIINGRVVDISKRNVGRHFRRVFGYELDVDPARHSGTALRKSNGNATHDGTPVCCPIQDPDPDAVYQRLIDNRLRDGVCVVYRVAVFGPVVPVVIRKYYREEERFAQQFASEPVSPSHVLGAEELARILEFTAALGIDYGELDVLRDNADGRIYIVDANATPYSSAYLNQFPSWVDRAAVVDLMVEHLVRLVDSFRLR